MPDLSDLLDAANIEGLALDRQPTGWVASLSFPPGYGNWSPLEFATTASEAIAKALRLHAPAPQGPVASIVPPPPY